MTQETIEVSKEASRMSEGTLIFIVSIAGVLILLLIGIVGYFIKKDTEDKESKANNLSKTISSFTFDILGKLESIKNEIHSFKIVFVDVKKDVERNSDNLSDMKKDLKDHEERIRILEIKK